MARPARLSWAERVGLYLWRSQAARFALLVGPCAAFLAVFYFYPVVRLIPLSVEAPAFTLKGYAKFFETGAYLNALIRTVHLSLMVTILTLLIGYPVAYTLAKVKPSTAQMLMVFILLPFWTSILVRSYAWIVLLQRHGIVNNLLQTLGLIDQPLPLMFNMTGVVVGMTHVLLPFMVLSLYSVLVGIDQRLYTAAQSLGAGAGRRFFWITLPLSLPGLAAGSLLVFVLALGFYITPALLGGARVLTIAMLIQIQVEELLNWSFAAATALILLALSVAIITVFDRVMGLDRIWVR